MWRRTLLSSSIATEGRCFPMVRRLFSSASSAAVNSLILRSLKEHYLEKVNPPPPYTIIKGALDRDGPALRREYKGEEITISVMRLANIIPEGAEDDGDDGDEAINQLFLHVDVSKPGREDSLHFLCGLYPDAVGIHSVSLRPKAASLSLASLNKYQGRVFQELDEKLRDAFHSYIEERGVNESLFRFLQAWLYVKDHRNLMRWFKSVGTFINEESKS
ncbi:Uncharacterized protein AXF42_Ash015019 [Apostasia shenzhenica]|uniref:Mitochondrial acidic protein mam33 n=1 Tax=Apostasia shenzhenica TaxID=1088818 RepID=A0A2I0B2X2_9ASPA|nr:Uncharacterized protein AXF42_Ash015019 [Apostasia shenzhenica]